MTPDDVGGIIFLLWVVSGPIAAWTYYRAVKVWDVYLSRADKVWTAVFVFCGPTGLLAAWHRTSGW